MTHAISLAHVQARFGGSETLAPKLADLVRRCRADYGCLAYELLRDGEKSERWTLRGEWINEEALLAHLSQPHLQVLGQLLASGQIRHLALSTDRAPAYPLGLAS